MSHFLHYKMRMTPKRQVFLNTNTPAVVLAEDVLDSLRQGEGLAGAVGPNNEDRRQKNGDGRGDGQNGFFLLGIQTRIQLLIPLPEDKAGNEKLFKEIFGCRFYIRKLSDIL